MYRVTPKSGTDVKASPKDFGTLQEAIEYADNLGCDFEKNYNRRFPFTKTVGIIKYGRRVKPCARNF